MLHQVAIMVLRLPRRPSRSRPARRRRADPLRTGERIADTSAAAGGTTGLRAAAGLGPLLRGAVCGLWLVGLTSCQRTPPALPSPTRVPSGQTLQVLAFPEYFVPNTLSRFEAETGNKIVAGTYATNEELQQRLAHGSAGIDVVFPSSYALERLIREDKLLLMPRERVPNLVHVTTEFRNPTYDPSLAHCIPYAWSTAGLGYLVSKDGPPRQPDSLTAVFAQAGPRVVWLDDMRATLGLALRHLGRSASSQQAADLLEAQQLLLAALPRVDALVDDPAPLLRSGKTTLSLAWSTELYSLHREREDIRFAVPQEGTILYVDYGCVLAGSQHPEVAFAFLNHLLAPQVSAEITNTRLLPLTNESARRLLEGDGRNMWGLFEYLRHHNRSYEILRDVGPAQAAYEQVWRTLKESLAARQTRRDSASASGPGTVSDKAPDEAPDKAPGKVPDKAPDKVPDKTAAKPRTTGSPTQPPR